MTTGTESPDAGLRGHVRAARAQALGRALDDYVAETGYVPAEAVKVRRASELPLSLMRAALKTAPNAIWGAWSLGVRVWFVQAWRHAESAAAGETTMYLLFRDMDGRAVAGGVWGKSAGQRWKLLRLDAGGRSGTGIPRASRGRLPPIGARAMP